MKHSVVVKEEMNDTMNPVRLGSKVHLTKLPTAKDKKQLGPRLFTARLLNAEVNLISDWVVEHKPQLVKDK
jgi:hypothetical protein